MDSFATAPTHPERSIDVLVIGGGPAGLALGVELKRRKLSFLILEKGATVGHSWAGMPRRLKLVSPWKTNDLPETAKGLFPPHYQISREEFLSYLQAYAEESQLPLQTGVNVHAVNQLENGGFRVETSEGDFLARVVVNATGYFSNPFEPEIQGAARSEIPQLHVAEYREPAKLARILGKSRGTILIVGQRLSAGQTMIELIDAGFEVALSHRSPIQFGAGPISWWFLYRTFPWLEWLKLKIHGDLAPGNDVRMQGGRARKLIQSGTVKTFPAIQRFEKKRITFDNGQSLQPDLVIYATGFRPALQHLSSLALPIGREDGVPQLRDFESVGVPGLFFIGVDHARNFQSRFLRGIRKDVALLAARLEQTLAGAPPQHRNIPAMSPPERSNIPVPQSTLSE